MSERGEDDAVEDTPEAWVETEEDGTVLVAAKPGSDLLASAWAALAPALRRERLGTIRTRGIYGWEYMGSVRQPDGRAFHEFRHRMHPKTGGRELVQAPWR